MVPDQTAVVILLSLCLLFSSSLDALLVSQSTLNPSNENNQLCKLFCFLSFWTEPKKQVWPNEFAVNLCVVRYIFINETRLPGIPIFVFRAATSIQIQTQSWRWIIWVLFVFVCWVLLIWWLFDGECVSFFVKLTKEPIFQGFFGSGDVFSFAIWLIC